MSSNFIRFKSHFLSNGGASAIVGGQFGSEAKGLAAGLVAEHCSPRWRSDVICTTNAGAQAGHTTVMENGNKFVCYHLPTVGVLQPETLIYLNPGSIIDVDLLISEVKLVSKATGEDTSKLISRIRIHPNAAVISNAHKVVESTGTRDIGSTQKGVGAALSDKVMRKVDSVASKSHKLNFTFRVDPINLASHMAHGGIVVIEIPQGTGLSLNNGPFFPKCTSRDCWVGQGLADAGIHPHFHNYTLMVQRTLPIRVGHIYDEAGNKVGDSGPFYSDSKELNWSSDLPGIQPEITTVTKRQRRIATFSYKQYYDALTLNRPSYILNTFCNYMTEEQLTRHAGLMREVENRVGVHPTHLWSFGPRVSDTRETI